MRQVAPWGKPVTNPGAFGMGADDETFGARLRMPGSTPDQVRLGAPGDNAPGEHTGPEGGVVVTPSWTAALVGAAGVAVGGALIGYLATGGRGWRGPYIGATANMALFFGGSAIAGRNSLSTATTATLGLLAVASAGGAGYFFMQQRRRK
jgi:hypothetical protein